MLTHATKLEEFFQKKLNDLKCRTIVKAYLISTLSKYKYPENNYSNVSLTLLFNKGQSNRDFITLQNLADWIFFCEVIFPQHLNDCSKQYYYSLAQMSYYNCYKLLNRQLDLYLQLADELESLILQTQQIMQKP